MQAGLLDLTGVRNLIVCLKIDILEIIGNSSGTRCFALVMYFVVLHAINVRPIITLRRTLRRAPQQGSVELKLI
jgi:hypothetical protein